MVARIVALACACLMSVQSIAADRGFYFGVTGGRAEYDFERPPGPVLVVPDVDFVPPPRFDDDLIGVIARPRQFIPAGAMFSSPGAEDHDTSWGILAGYRIFKYMAAELAYVDLGKLATEYDVAIAPPFPIPEPSVPVTIRDTLTTRGPTVTLLGIVPLTDAWDLYVRAGAYFLDSELKSRIGNGAIGSTTFGSDGLVWGAGTQLGIGKHWAARLDFQRYQEVGQLFNPGRADIDVFSLGILYRL